MKYFIIILYLLLSTTVYATLYESAEDKTTKGWSVYNNISTATIKNVYDKDKKSRVILLESEDSRDGYMLSLERNSTVWCKTKGKSLQWSMKTKEHFVLLVSMQTLGGHRYIVYTSGNKNGRGYYGLGKKSTNGEWQKFSRDLDLDLKRYEPTNEIVVVDTFFVRGNMRIDDIQIVDIDKKGFVPKKVESCKIKIPKITTTQRSNLKIYDDTPPNIKLNGYPILSIKLGGKYIEQGAIAVDDVDGKLPVKISEEVDTNRVGTYTLFYMAKDRVGNTSMTTRVVSVGSPTPHTFMKVDNIDNKIVDKKEAILSVEGDRLEFDFPSEEEQYQELGLFD